MTEPLWTWVDLVAATGGVAEGEVRAGITGVSIDTRTLQPGDLFVALRGGNQDGHVYVAKAFEKGAAAALVAADFVTPAGAGPLIRVGDSKRDPALVGLERLGRAARARLSPEARVIAVTGSVGKTSTKEMLRVCLSSVDPRTHASEKSYNNHWGVPLTLARMPKDTRYGVFEIGMNHAGEIALLSPMVRPHVAIITTVGPVHLGFFKSVEEIADAKAEIFLGLEPGGVAVLNADDDVYGRLRSAAAHSSAKLVTFGKTHRARSASVMAGLDPAIQSPECNSQPFALDGRVTPGHDETRMSGRTRHFDLARVVVRPESASQDVEVTFDGRTQTYRLGAIGEHQAVNSLAVLAALDTVGVDIRLGCRSLERFEAAAGRGARIEYRLQNRNTTFIDESYNANPLSMAAALNAMWQPTVFSPGVRRIAVLGDMRELGDQSARLHRELLGPVTAANVDKVFACGPFMRELYDVLPQALRGAYAETSTGLIGPILAAIAPGDVIMVKGSLGTRMAPIVDALKAHLAKLAGPNHH